MHTVRNIIVVVSIAVMIYTNVYIFSETRRQKKRINNEQLPQEEVKRMKRDNKAANTLAIILAALVVTFFPVVIATVFKVMRSSESTPGNAKEASALHVVFTWCSVIFVLFASLVNPIVYCWRSRKLRRAFLEILRFKQLENSSAVTGVTEIQPHRHGVEPTYALSLPAVGEGPSLPPSLCHY